MSPQIVKYETQNSLYSDLTKYLKSIISCRTKQETPMVIGLSGSSMIDNICEALNKEFICSDLLQSVIFILCDERLVPEEDSESTFAQYKQNLNNFESLQFLKINQAFVNEPDKCASDYEKQLRTILKCSDDVIPHIDCLLLGLGPDGHTASLFPNHIALKIESTNIIFTGVDNSPKQPPKRISLTLNAINSANDVFFVVCGKGKSQLVKNIVSQSAPNLPAALVKPKCLRWLLDSGAAECLSNIKMGNTIL
ncbi:hypothetical protein GJ496_009827 [Pomphorhynchus laevis]|nr:hypothetical protein GJ496_008439 [Pomphorhynchus laevis]KAI0981970.1 hypothetical protein GJ496_007213 [Pomphorhynchus laevis]KAI0985288.1 hypothetical protein GJ496_009827 [Pomphorhynchus laevis]